MTEQIVRLKNFRSDVSFKNGLDESDIFVVGYSSSIVDLCSKIVKHFIWHYFVLI